MIDYFGEHVAARYDDSTGEYFDAAVIQSTVDFLAEHAGDGAALELAIGTGRIALPLARRGIRVHGIDLSTAMVASSQSLDDSIKRPPQPGPAQPFLPLFSTAARASTIASDDISRTKVDCDVTGMLRIGLYSAPAGQLAIGPVADVAFVA